MLNNSSLSQTATIVVFIDAAVSDYQTLQTGVIAGVETVILSPNQNGIEEITDFLQQHPQVTTIHIVSHGSPGCLYLGNSQLNLDNISKYANLLPHWQSENILLYGCNVAAGDAGEEFIRKLHQITNATISASTTKTGNAALGGNWELEVNIPATNNVETFHGTSLHHSFSELRFASLRMTQPGTSLAFHADTIATYQGVFAPTLVGSYDTPGQAVGVQVVGNYAYVADGDSGLQIIDISNPQNPILKGNYDTPGLSYGLKVVGNYAYVADYYNGLQIIDISNPSNPILKGNYDTQGWSVDLDVVGNYAFVGDYYNGLQIIDISNPSSPILKGSYATPGNAFSVQVVGNYAYIVNNGFSFSGSNTLLQIIDISDLSNPILKGSYNATSTSGGANIQIVSKYAYVTNWHKGLEIIDISNPTSPTLKGNYDTSSSGSYAQKLQVVGNYAYVANYDGGLQIINVSEFTNLPTNQATKNE